MTLQRLPDWPRRFVDFLEARAGAVFSWGANDCVLFSADCVVAVTGIDPLTHLRGRWADGHGAARALRQAGGLHAAVTSVLGAPLPTPALAQRADVLLIETEYQFLAVCDGDRWACPSGGGLLRGPMAEATHAWRVG